jgi:hypothetical protein
MRRFVLAKNREEYDIWVLANRTAANSAYYVNHENLLRELSPQHDEIVRLDGASLHPRATEIDHAIQAANRPTEE